MDLFLSNRWFSLLVLAGATALALYIGMINLNEVRQIQMQADRSPASSPRETASSQGQTSQSDLRAISNWHLFGEAEKEAASSTPKPVVQRTEAPKTRLKLTLQGIFSPTVTGQKGWAIIEAPGENPKAYQIGDEVPGGATLTAVEVDQIILTRNNRQESLPLEMKELSSDNLDFDEHEEPEPIPMAPQQPRGRARARAAPPPAASADSPEMDMLPSAEPEMPAEEPEIQADTGYEMETEPKEAVPSSPAIQAAEQDLIEEMKRLRESFKNSQ